MCQCAQLMVPGQSQTSLAKVTICSKISSVLWLVFPSPSVVLSQIIFTRLNHVISIPVEVHCGVPPSIPHSVMLWDKMSIVGSRAVYQCKSGYRNVGEGNTSVCTASGEWDEASLLCEGDNEIHLH